MGLEMKTQLTILTNDPSITAWGWAVIRNGKVIDTGCIKTSSEQKARRIRKGDDRVRRVSEINRALLLLINKYRVNLLISELPHGSQSASAAVMIGICTGVVQTLADTLCLPIEWYSEGDAKKAVVNKRSASKSEMIKAISELYKVPWTGIGYKDEAIADALAVYRVAENESPVLRFHK